MSLASPPRAGCLDRQACLNHGFDRPAQAMGWALVADVAQIGLRFAGVRGTVDFRFDFS
jgi:hypothetical protein